MEEVWLKEISKTSLLTSSSCFCIGHLSFWLVSAKYFSALFLSFEDRQELFSVFTIFQYRWLLLHLYVTTLILIMKKEKPNNSGGPEGAEKDRPQLSVKQFCGITAAIWLFWNPNVASSYYKNQWPVLLQQGNAP